MSATSDLALTLGILIASFVVGGALVYVIVRAAIVSALRHHALWRADGSFEVDLERHRRDGERA